MIDRFSHESLQWTVFLVTQGDEICWSTQSSGIPCEAHIGEVTTSIANGEFDDAAVVGDASPDRGMLVSVQEKGQFTVIDPAGGAQTQHVSAQGNPFQWQMFSDIALDQIGHRVRDGEIGHGSLPVLLDR